MDKYFKYVFLLVIFCGCTQQSGKPDIRIGLLKESLNKSFSEKDWYVPLSEAIDGLDEEQVYWKDSTDNHSIAELVSHLNFWNERMLIAFNGQEPGKFDNNNDATFNYCKNNWVGCVAKNDSLRIAWGKALDMASKKQLDEWGSQISEISSHNGYHTGQIVYVRKMNGWWKSKK